MSKLCDLCSKSFDNILCLVTLPCGYMVCSDHLVKLESSNFKCSLCRNFHSMKKIYQISKNKANLESLISDDVLNFQDKFKSIQKLVKSHRFLINEHLDDLINKIDIKREELKLEIMKQIDAYSNRLIEQVKIYGKDFENDFVKDLDALKPDSFKIYCDYNLDRIKIEDRLKFVLNEHNRIDSFASKLDYLQKKFQTLEKIDLKSDKLELNLEKSFGQLYIPSAFKAPKPMDLNRLGYKISIKGHDKPIWSIEEAKPNVIVTSSEDGNIHTWNITTGQKLKSFNLPTWFSNVKLKPNGDIISCSGDGTIRAWNDRLYKILLNKCEVFCIEKWGDKIISGDSNKRIKIWNLDTIQYELLPEQHTGYVYTLKLFDNGYLLSGSFDCSIKLWDLFKRKCLQTYSGHTGAVWCIDKLNDNQFISGSADKSIKVWTLDQSVCLITLNFHEGIVYSFQVFENSSFLSCSEDGSIAFWDDKYNVQVFKTSRNVGVSCIKKLSTGELAVSHVNGFLDLYEMI